MIEVDPDARELLARWAITPAVPVSELTAEAVREDDRAHLPDARRDRELSVLRGVRHRLRFSSEKSRWYFDQYLPPGIDRRTPLASPLLDRDLGKLPATLVVTAQCDPLRDEGEHHAKNLREAGVKAELRRYPGMIHGFFQMTGALEGSRQLHRELGDWMQAHTEQARRANQ